MIGHILFARRRIQVNVSMGLFKPPVDVLKERFQRLDARNRNASELKSVPPIMFRKASVLIPLFYRDGDLRILLTKRSENLRHHAGYVAFPGGMADEEDGDEINTALREAEEEIGLKPSDVEIVAVLCHAFTIPNSLVTPVLGLIPPDFVPQINEPEVDLVFDLPLARFLSSDGLAVTERKTSDGKSYRMHHFSDRVRNKNVVTFGFTAGLCIEVALVAYQSELSFVLHSDYILSKDTALKYGSGSRVIKQALQSKY